MSAEGWTVVLPCRGEFGLRIRYHVPVVHALPGPKAVYIEPGDEALYPSSSAFLEVPRAPDAARRGLKPPTDQELVARARADAARRFPGAQVVETRRGGMQEARFVPEPVVRVGFRGDVVVCPRARGYGASKNWRGWGELVAGLQERGLRVVAAGAPDSSAEVPCPVAWAHERFLDASIEAMRAARLVVATDAGLAHLAVLCGAPLLLVTDEGRVAPGPVLDPQGNVMREEYWPVRLEEYYLAANHTGTRIELVDGWCRPEAVVERAAFLVTEAT